MNTGRPRLPRSDDPRVERRRAQYRNSGARRAGRPVEFIPPLPKRPRAVNGASTARARVCVVRGVVACPSAPTGEGSCVEWAGNRNDEGYGRLWSDGRVVYAHRMTLERKLGRPIRAGFQALHTCDNPPCVNPAHLYEGTPADNRRDAMVRGRATSSRALNANQARVIRSMRDRPAFELAALHGVSTRTIYRVWSDEQLYVRRDDRPAVSL